jgi:hypothetical protein
MVSIFLETEIDFDSLETPSNFFHINNILLLSYLKI